MVTRSSVIGIPECVKTRPSNERTSKPNISSRLSYIVISLDVAVYIGAKFNSYLIPSTCSLACHPFGANVLTSFTGSGASSFATLVIRLIRGSFGVRDRRI